MARHAPLLHGVRPIISFGQSNIACGFNAAASWPARLQYEQPPVWCYHKYCHNTGGADYATRDDWHRIQPFQIHVPASGDYWGSWELELCDALYGLGERAAVMGWEMGGNPLTTWHPSGSYNSTIKPWLQARIAELDSPKTPLLIMYQGESGVGSASPWADVMAAIALAVRADFGVDGIVIIQLPDTYPSGATISASQADYVASDARSRLAHNHGSTYIGDATHLDYASAKALAVGPDNGSTVRSVLTCIRELLA